MRCGLRGYPHMGLSIHLHVYLGFMDKSAAQGFLAGVHKDATTKRRDVGPSEY